MFSQKLGAIRVLRAYLVRLPIHGTTLQVILLVVGSESVWGSNGVITVVKMAKSCGFACDLHCNVEADFHRKRRKSQIFDELGQNAVSP